MITQAHSYGEIFGALYLIGGGTDGVLLVQITKARVPEHYVLYVLTLAIHIDFDITSADHI